MAMKEPKMLTVREVSERTGAAIPTVNLWCRSGKLQGARQEPTPYGEYWLIPESSIEGVQVRGRGRPPKDPAETTAKLNRAFREAKEAEEAGKKKVTKRGKR